MNIPADLVLKRSTSEPVAHASKKSKTSDPKTVANNNLRYWLEQFKREYEIDGTDGSEADEVGTITWRKGGKTVGCSFGGLMYLMDNEELDDNGKDFSVAKEAVEREFAPVAKFPDMLDELAAMFTEGAKLAREAGIDKVPAFDSAEDKTVYGSDEETMSGEMWDPHE